LKALATTIRAQNQGVNPTTFILQMGCTRPIQAPHRIQVLAGNRAFNQGIEQVPFPALKENPANGMQIVRRDTAPWSEKSRAKAGLSEEELFSQLTDQRIDHFCPVPICAEDRDVGLMIQPVNKRSKYQEAHVSGSRAPQQGVMIVLAALMPNRLPPW
jgi:hypothetical protein